VRGSAGFLDGPSEAVGENDEVPGGFAVRERLKHDVIAFLGVWSAVP
jgi:hypothetical protein